MKYIKVMREKKVDTSQLSAPPRNQHRTKLIHFFDKVKRKATPKNISNIFLIAFSFILFSTIVRFLLNPESPPLTFDWFLSVIQNVPQLSFDWLNFTEVSMGDWGIFNELRDAIFVLWNVLAKPVFFLGQCLVNIVGFIGYFLQQIFVLQGIGV